MAPKKTAAKKAPAKKNARAAAKPKPGHTEPAKGDTFARDLEEKGLLDDIQPKGNVLLQDQRDGAAAWNLFLEKLPKDDYLQRRVAPTANAIVKARPHDLDDVWFTLEELGRAYATGTLPHGEWVDENGTVILRRGQAPAKHVKATEITAWLAASSESNEPVPDGTPKLSSKPKRKETKQKDLEGNVKERPQGLSFRIRPSWRVDFETDKHEAAFVRSSIKTILASDGEEALRVVEKNLKVHHKYLHVPPSDAREKDRADILALIKEKGEAIVADGDKIAPPDEDEEE